jgi:hypothetical protein
MEDSTASYLTVVIIGVVVTLVVGQLLLRLGHDFISEIYDPGLTRSMDLLLGTLFHLFALGFLGLLSTANPVFSGLTGLQSVITRVGVVLLTLGAVYGAAVLSLAVTRARRDTHAVEDDFTAKYQQRGP